MFANDQDVNPYLQQEVMSASPIRLRLMLIQRAEELCDLVQLLWQDEDYAQGMQWLLRIRDILGELLNGVTDPENPLGKTVADFYVFLIQLVTEVEQSHSLERLGTLRELLNIEKETWKQVVEKAESSGAVGAPVSNSTANTLLGGSHISFEA